MKVCTPSVFSRFRAVFLGFRWLLAVGGLLFLGLSSCENESKNQGLAPEMESISSGKVVYLDKNTFKMVNLNGIKTDVLLNKGVNELLDGYVYLGTDNELIIALKENQNLLSLNRVDDTVIRDVLIKLQAIQLRYPKAENFSNYVDALEYANRILVEDKITDYKITPSKPIVKEEIESEESVFWVQFFAVLLAISLLIKSSVTADP